MGFPFLFRVFGVVLFLTGGVADNGLSVLTSFFTLLGAVVWDTVTLLDGTGGDTGDTGTL